jgi:hypothetical protein
VHVLGFNRVGLMARSLVCWLKQKKKDTGGWGSREPEQECRPRFPSAAMAAGLELSELH